MSIRCILLVLIGEVLLMNTPNSGRAEMFSLGTCPKSRAELRELHRNITDSLLDTPGTLVLKLLDQCQADVPALFTPDAQPCFQRVRDFYTNLSFGRVGPAAEQDQHRMGFKLKDEDYLAGKGLDFPQMMQPPIQLTGAGRLLHYLSDPAQFDRALADIALINKDKPPELQWKVLRYESIHLPTPDPAQTFGRTLILIPGDRFDRWVQLGRALPGDEKGVRPSVESVVAVQKKDRQGRVLAKPKVRFVDYWRNYKDQEIIRGEAKPVSMNHAWLRQEPGPDNPITLSTRLRSQQKAENCAVCHQSGVIPINPVPGSVPTAEERKTLESFNSRMAAYGAPDLDGALNLEALGPPLGPPNRTRSDEFLDRCSGLAGRSDKATSYQRIRSAMNCAACHDGQQMGAIKYPLPQSILKSYIVTTAKMPPGHSQLSSDERLGLKRCLEEEYLGHTDYGIRKQGLLQEWVANSAQCKLAQGAHNCEGTETQGECKASAISARSTGAVRPESTPQGVPSDSPEVAPAQ